MKQEALRVELQGGFFDTSPSRLFLWLSFQKESYYMGSTLSPLIFGRSHKKPTLRSQFQPAYEVPRQHLGP